jgi:ATP-binding cassette subfamily B protein
MAFAMFKMLRFLKPYKLKAALLLFAIFIQAAGVLRLPTLMSMIVNNGIVMGDKGYIIMVGAKMIVWTVLSALGALLASYLSARVGAAIGRDMREELFKKILSFSISEIDDFSTASLITRTTNDISTVQNALVLMLSMMLRVPMMAVGAIFEAVMLAPDMTWILALSVAVLIFFVVLILSLVMPKFMLYQKLVDKVNLLTRENLTGLRVIRAFNNEKYEQKKFNTTNMKIMKTDFYISRLMGLENPLMTLIFNGTSLLCIWIGITHLAIDASYLGKMMAFMQYATQVILSFFFLAILFVMIPRASVSAKRIDEVLKTKEKIVWKDVAGNDKTEKPAVEFRNVSFRYAGADEDVISNVSFMAKAGETTAFIGSTGSGKSTLVNLVARFYDVTSGEILVNGIDVREYSKEGLMKKIGFVPQKGFLFSGTIKSNILFGVDDKNDEKCMKAAAKIAQANEFINKLPDKYETKIVEGGTNVSGGQRQRLSIARALAKNPEIYIFDDAFSALDMKTDKKLREALAEVTKNSVILTVAQRVSTIRDAEQIVVLDNGKVAGIGTHFELIKKCRVYQEICRSQLSEAEYKKEVEDARS